MGNPFIHVELQTARVPEARAFYSQLFDWVMDERALGGVGDYLLIDTGGDVGGGMMANSAASVSQWLTYALVDDVEEYARRATELGGKVLMPVTEVQGMGLFTIISDPTGGVLGLWEATAPMPAARPAKKAAKKKAAKKVAKKKAAKRTTKVAKKARR